MTTAAPEVTATKTTPKRAPSRASRAAARNSTTAKPAGKATDAKATEPRAEAATTGPKPEATAQPEVKPEAEAKALTVNEQKRALAERMVAVVTADLSANDVPGVSREDALLWAGQLMSYFPGARQGKIAWPEVLGAVSMAGARKKDDDTK